jgi:hypothetical protein
MIRSGHDLYFNAAVNVNSYLTRYKYRTNKCHKKSDAAKEYGERRVT